MRDRLSRGKEKRVLNFLPRAVDVGHLLWRQQDPIDIEKSGVWEPRRISVGEASANPFACNSHDQEVFREIERPELLDFESLQCLFQFDYRSVLYALCEAYNTRNIQKARKRELQGRPKPLLMNWAREVERERKSLPGLERLKKWFDEIYIDEYYAVVSHHLVEFQTKISMASTAFDTNSNAILTVYPLDNAGRHKALVSWFKDERLLVNEEALSDLIEEMDHASDGAEMPFVEHILGGSYNVYASSDYETEMPSDVKDRVKEARSMMYDGIIEEIVMAGVRDPKWQRTRIRRRKRPKRK